MEYETDDDLDLSWIQEEQSLLEGRTQIQSSKTIMKEIAFHCIYVGNTQEIAGHHRVVCPLELCDNHSLLSNAMLLKYIKDCQHYKDIKYKLSDVLLYHVNIDFEHIQAFMSCETAGSFITVSMFEDLVVPPSLSLFHEINEIYMFYQDKSVSSIDLVSILKTEMTKKNTHTKKVRIAETGGKPAVPKRKHKHTRKKS